jgi:hypothetical protein
MRAMRVVLATAGAAAAGAAGCGGSPGQVVNVCTSRPALDVSTVGNVVALARHEDGYVIAGLMFDTLRVATIRGNGEVTPASAVGLLPDVPVTSVPFHAALRSDGSVWTIIFPERDSLVGYAVDTRGGEDMTYVFAPHFTNSEPFVLWYPTAFWFGEAPEDTNIAMQRVEISGMAETAAPHVWTSTIRTVEMFPGTTTAAPIAVVDGATQRALTPQGLYDYSQSPPVLITPMPEPLSSLGPGSPGDGTMVAAAGTEDGIARFVHVDVDDSIFVSQTRPGTPLAVGLLAIEPRVYAWLAPDATLQWRYFDGEVAGPATPAVATGVVTAPGPDIVRSGNDYAYAFTDGDRWFLARHTCE